MKSNFTTFAKKQRGLSLVEIMVGLGIVAAIIVGVLSLASGASSSQKTQQATSDLISARAAVQQLGYQTGTYGTGSLNEVLINSGRLPSTLRVSGTNLTHSFNGAFTITGAGTFFHIQLESIPKDACIGLLTSVAGFDGYSVGTTAPTTVSATYAFPTGLADANTRCAHDTDNSIFFTAR